MEEEVREMYHAFENKEEQVFYLILVTSGFRFGKSLGLRVENVDFDIGMVTPKYHYMR